MEKVTPSQWSEVKKVKFHHRVIHRVRKFYHQDLFRKIYTVAIIWLIGANVFSLIQYHSFADELEAPQSEAHSESQVWTDVSEGGGDSLTNLGDDDNSSDWTETSDEDNGKEWEDSNEESWETQEWEIQENDTPTDEENTQNDGDEQAETVSDNTVLDNTEWEGAPTHPSQASEWEDYIEWNLSWDSNSQNNTSNSGSDSDSENQQAKTDTNDTVLDHSFSLEEGDTQTPSSPFQWSEDGQEQNFTEEKNSWTETNNTSNGWGWSSSQKPKAEENIDIWKTLNTKEIEGTTDKNWLILKVKAPVKSFPKWTELRISILDDKDEIKELKENTIKQHSNVLANNDFIIFDIKFIYTLPDGEEVELQPLVWKKVEISFNYINNKLAGLSSDELNELKVYYENDWKIKEATINEEKTESWEMVVDWEKMSKYFILAKSVPQTSIEVLKENIDTIVEDATEYLADKRAEELAQIWTTLNEEAIKLQYVYKDIIANASIPAESFPKVADLKLTPITDSNDMKSIKNQLLEKGNITKKSDLVAFKLSFLYTLSNWVQEQLEPLEWKTVDVSFIYA